jgi:hypothetical protein
MHSILRNIKRLEAVDLFTKGASVPIRFVLWRERVNVRQPEPLGNAFDQCSLSNLARLAPKITSLSVHGPDCFSKTLNHFQNLQFITLQADFNSTHLAIPKINNITFLFTTGSGGQVISTPSSIKTLSLVQKLKADNFEKTVAPYLTALANCDIETLHIECKNSNVTNIPKSVKHLRLHSTPNPSFEKYLERIVSLPNLKSLAISTVEKEVLTCVKEIAKLNLERLELCHVDLDKPMAQLFLKMNLNILILNQSTVQNSGLKLLHEHGTTVLLFDCQNKDSL